jgi:hypothetical protein
VSTPLFHPRSRRDEWRARLRLPEQAPVRPVSLWLPARVRIATGYLRVVVGDRGPYIELATEQLRQRRLYVPPAARWRFASATAFYEEYRTRPDEIMVYHQRLPVTYADYRVGHWYISPFDLRDRHGRVLITGRPPSEKL